LIKLPTTKKQSGEDEKSGEHVLNIFTRDEARGPIHKINTIPLYTGFFNLIDVWVSWVDTKRHRIPLIELNLVEESRKGVLMFYGPTSTEVFISFAAGLSKKSEIRQFSSWGNTRESYSISTDNVDDNGYVVIRWIHQENDTDPKIKSYFWNGKMFELREEKKPKDQAPHQTGIEE
jgi:hypothetical protein